MNRICKRHNVETQETGESLPFISAGNQHALNELLDEGIASFI